MPEIEVAEKPYIFICYAHADYKIINPIICAMRENHYRIWYDLGIGAGNEWSNTIADHLAKCGVFIAFITRNSAQSENCLDEIAYAKKERKPSLLIFLEDGVKLPKGTEMQTNRFQHIYKKSKSQKVLIEEICGVDILKSCRQTNQQDLEPGDTGSGKKPAQEMELTASHMVLSEKEQPSEAAQKNAVVAGNNNGNQAVKKTDKNPEQKVERPTGKEEKENRTWIWSWAAPILELTYCVIGAYALKEVLAYTDSGWARFGLMLIPHSLLALILSVIILTTGKRVDSSTKESAYAMTMFMCTISSLAAMLTGIFWIDIQMNYLVRILLAIGLNIVPTLIVLLIYFYAMDRCSR